MKKIWYFSFVLLATISSCDIIDHPIIDYGIGYREDLYGPAPIFEPVTGNGSGMRNVLLEDFTGHVCGNCPAAHEEAEAILVEQGNRVAVVSIHAGELAEPTPPDYLAEYRIAEGEFYFSQLAFQVNPIGRLNRVGGPSAIWNYGQWATEIESQLMESAKVGLQMEIGIDTIIGNLNIHVFQEWFQNVSGEHQLVIFITESNVISPQLEYLPEPYMHEFYNHKHILRATVSGAAGLVTAQNPTIGQNELTSYTYEWNNNWDWHNCSVVAFVVDGTNGEVLNVIEKKLDE